MPQQPLPKKPNSIQDFGVDFQKQLIAEIVVNHHSFGIEIIDIIKPDYFKNQYFSFLIKLIKEYYEKHDLIPNYDGIRIEIDSAYMGVPETHKVLVDTLEQVRNCPFNNHNVPEIAMLYCKWQSAKNAIEAADKKLKSGGFEEYDELEELLRKAITFKEHDEAIDFETGIEHVLNEDYRDPIPTGIAGLDAIMNGGLGRGELAVAIAPLGVGKTTLLTIIGSNGYQHDKNVLHIFFEDKMDEVRRKYLTHWSEIPLNELRNNRTHVFNKMNEVITQHSTAKLRLEKLKAETINIARLRRIIKRERNKLNGKLDLVIIDYADCIVGEQDRHIEEWVGEGRTMRQLEGIAEEFNVALWTAVQGGRKSTSASVVEVDMIGGNIKKAQVAHFIMSIAKTLPQKDQKLATIAILKSRFGDDGKVFTDCTFDNSRMIIDTSTMQTIDAFEDHQHHIVRTRAQQIVQAFRENAAQEAGANNTQ